MYRRLAALAASVLVTGCASRSVDVGPSYASPLAYETYNCQQLAGEARRVSARAAELAGIQDKNRTNDALLTTVSVVVFWPAVFALNGNNQTTAELASLKGQMKAIEQVSNEKQCNIRFETEPPKPPQVAAKPIPQKGNN